MPNIKEYKLIISDKNREIKILREEIEEKDERIKELEEKLSDIERDLQFFKNWGGEKEKRKPKWLWATRG